MQAEGRYRLSQAGVHDETTLRDRRSTMVSLVTPSCRSEVDGDSTITFHSCSPTHRQSTQRQLSVNLSPVVVSPALLQWSATDSRDPLALYPAM